MTPEDLVRQLEKACPEGLRSVILYGSAAAGDHAGKRSDYNVLVVADRLDLAVLKALQAPAAAWEKAGNPSPLLFTIDRLKQAADVFPIELLDIRDCHEVLWGEDVIPDLDIRTDALRLQLEHELRSKLISLRQQYLLTQGKPKRVAGLMTESVSTFLVLFRGALRLFERDVPAKKLAALEQLREHINFDMGVFETIDGLKRGDVHRRDLDVDEVFGTYLKTVETVVDAVDAAMKKGDEDV
jgi:predicted nucleotidyltransferase